MFYDDTTEIDFDTLRSDLLYYFGTAAFSVASLAMADVARVENTDEDELLEIARECGFDVRKYYC